MKSIKVKLLRNLQAEVISYGQIRGKQPFDAGSEAEALAQEEDAVLLRQGSAVFWVSQADIQSLPSKPSSPVKVKSRACAADPVLGKIYVRSWGYDQTNVDAYQVVRATEKSLWLRPICLQTVPNSQGHMCERVKPMPDHFGESGRVQRVRRVGEIPSHAIGTLWDGQRDYYCSWYA